MGNGGRTRAGAVRLQLWSLSVALAIPKRGYELSSLSNQAHGIRCSPNRDSRQQHSNPARNLLVQEEPGTY